MFVVTVIFEVQPGRADVFKSAMLAQASYSLEGEPDCLQFDVCQDPERAEVFFLYEIYRDPAAFDVHLASPHYKSFDAAVAPLVANKTVKLYTKL